MDLLKLQQNTSLSFLNVKLVKPFSLTVRACAGVTHKQWRQQVPYMQSDLLEVTEDRGNGLNLNWPICHSEVSIWTLPSGRTSNPRIPAGPPGKLNLVRCALSRCFCRLCSLWCVLLSCSVSVFILVWWWCFYFSSVHKDISSPTGPAFNTDNKLWWEPKENMCVSMKEMLKLFSATVIDARRDAPSLSSASRGACTWKTSNRQKPFWWFGGKSSI